MTSLLFSWNRTGVCILIVELHSWFDQNNAQREMLDLMHRDVAFHGDQPDVALKL